MPEEPYMSIAQDVVNSLEDGESVAGVPRQSSRQPESREQIVVGPQWSRPADGASNIPMASVWRFVATASAD